MTVNGFWVPTMSAGPVATSNASTFDQSVSASEYSQKQPRQSAAAAGLTGGKIVGWLTWVQPPKRWTSEKISRGSRVPRICFTEPSAWSS